MPTRAVSIARSKSKDQQRDVSRRHDPNRACIAELVSAQARSTPEAIAIADKDDVLTYGELDARANGLAQHLRALGVGPGVVVGLCLARSVAMVVGALGIH